MKIITKEIETAFQKQGYCGDKPINEIKIILKLFNPVGAGTWYLYEREDEDIYWGFANLGDPAFAECGTVSMRELTELKLPLGLRIERDIHFPVGKHSLQEVMDIVKSGNHI